MALHRDARLIDCRFTDLSLAVIGNLTPGDELAFATGGSFDFAITANDEGPNSLTVTLETKLTAQCKQTVGDDVIRGCWKLRALYACPGTNDDKLDLPEHERGAFARQLYPLMRAKINEDLASFSIPVVRMGWDINLATPAIADG